MTDGGGVSLESIKPIASIAPPSRSVRSLIEAAEGSFGESRLGERDGRGGWMTRLDLGSVVEVEVVSGVEAVLMMVGMEFSEGVREGLGLGLND